MSITIHAVLHGIARLRIKWSIIKLRKVRLPRPAREVCLPDGRNGTRRKVAPTMWTIAHVQLLGWTQEDKPRTRVVCLPDGRNDALRMVGSSMRTTTPDQ